jgi:hypothetical protein
MRTRIACVLAVGVLALPLAAESNRRYTLIDLGPQANQKLKDGYGSDGNTLAALPTGEGNFGGVRFRVGDGQIHLSGNDSTDLPEKADGIKVNAKCAKLHFLHATHFSGKDGAIIGAYTVNYDDMSQQTIPIVYGKDVLDWWYTGDSKEPTRGKVAWTGDNDDAKGNGAKIRLYLLTWKNPEPGKKVMSIDFASTNADKAAPFCVAITAEE